MSETNELGRIRAKRAELEAESRTLKEMQKNMEIRINILEEKTSIEELENNNKATRNAVVQLESKMKMLENRLKQASQEQIIPAPEKEPPEASANPAPSDKTETLETAETAPDEFQENIIVVEAIDNEPLVENQQNLREQQEKRNTGFSESPHQTLL